MNTQTHSIYTTVTALLSPLLVDYLNAASGQVIIRNILDCLVIIPKCCTNSRMPKKCSFYINMLVRLYKIFCSLFLKLPKLIAVTNTPVPNHVVIPRRCSRTQLHVLLFKPFRFNPRLLIKKGPTTNSAQPLRPYALALCLQDYLGSMAVYRLSLHCAKRGAASTKRG